MSWKFWEKNNDPLADLNDLSGDFAPPSQGATDPFANDPFANDMGGMPQPTPQPQFSPDQHPQGMVFQPTEPQTQSSGDGDKQVLLQELILARLDNIKNQLDVLNHRLATLEETRQQAKNDRGPWYANR